MNKRIQSHTLFICKRHFTVDQIYVYLSRKSLKEGALPTLNLPRPSANANATNNRSKRAIEKPEEYALSQEQMPQLPPPKAYISFEEFKQRIKNLALTKFWNIAIQEDLVTATFTTSNYVLPTYEIFVNNVNCAKRVIPKKFDYFVFQNSDLQQPLHQDECFTSKSCKLLVLPSENICNNCHAENIIFKIAVNFKKFVLTAPAKLNAPVKFTSPDRIKLTLHQKRLECKQLEREISNMRKALESDSKKVSSEPSSDFQKLFSQFNEKEVPSFMKLL